VTKDEPRRKLPRSWFAIGFATVLMFFSFVLFAYALDAADNDETEFAGGVLGIAIGLVPAVFGCAAAVSNRPRPLRGTLLATLVWLVVAVPIALVDIPTGLVAGFGAGGVVALNRAPTATTSARSIAVAATTLYVLILQWLIPPAGLLVGAVLPLIAIGVADAITAREAATDEPDQAPIP
jgi:hypothetical protein